MSVSCGSAGVVAASGIVGYTVTLTALSSIVGYTVSGSATAGIKVQADGNVSERTIAGYFEQNPSTEWCDADGVSGIGSDFEAMLTKTSGDNPDSGPSLATWHTISSDLTWEWSATDPATRSFSGTLQVREISDTGNSDSASVTIDVSAI